MNYFFVFQNETYKWEHRGGYLWAPQYGRIGQRVSHYETMKSVKQGDIIIHSLKKKIVAISRAKKDVYAAKKPVEIKNPWQDQGWRVDVDYITFAKTIETSDYKDELLRLRPKTNAPFNRKGHGNPGYLFLANKEMYDFLLHKILGVQTDDSEKQKIINLLNLCNDLGQEQIDLQIQMDFEEVKATQLTQQQLARHAKHSRPPKTQKTESTVYYRSPYIRELVKTFAEGKCQLCKLNAPFYDKDHKPYLEEHHIKYLSDGGSDTMDNVVAICPNCHRKIHILEDEEDRMILFQKAEENQKRYERLLRYAEGIEESSCGAMTERL